MACRDDEIAHARSLLKPYLPEKMEGYDVSPLVNNPRNDSPECIRPVEGSASTAKVGVSWEMPTSSTST
jgi:putative SOS response-associated peptidase YedK